MAYVEYDYRSGELGCANHYLLPPLLRMLDRPSGPILDLGCGNGAIARVLLSKGYDVYGVDASTSGVSVANMHAPGRFHVLDVASGQLPDALASIRFQKLISTEVIEHLYEPRALLRLAASALASEGGELLISTPYHGYLKNLALALSNKMDAHFTALWDGGHIKFFSRKTLTVMLEEHGFSVRGFAGAGRIPWLWKSMLLRAVRIDESQSVHRA